MTMKPVGGHGGPPAPRRGMRLYAALSRVFPRSFTAKVLAVAFVGTHVPLLALVARALTANGALEDQLDVLLWALGATLLGTAATLLALRAMLAPLFLVEQTMRQVEEQGTSPILPARYGDEVGRLMARTNRLVLHFNDAVEENLRQAQEDALTGLLNRRGFDAALPRGQAGAVLMIDLDRFKAVNDRHGHAAGDAVLVQTAGVIAASLRGQDIVARFGGEEFVVYLPDAQAEEAVQVAERIRQAIAAEVVVEDTAVSASIGVAVAMRGQSTAEAIARADAAAYAAKAQGRNRVTLAA
jgi:diguanylate cyclase (GGDEF)-like protein